MSTLPPTPATDSLSQSARRGRLFAGTSGFAYPTWVPRFYTPGRASRKLLSAYAARLPAVELNSTFYRRPAGTTIQRWLAETPEHFRFCPKAQRGATWRAWASAEANQDAADSIAWLTSAMADFGERLGCVLLGAPGSLERDDEALARLLEAWPADLPLALQLDHHSWSADEVYEQLRHHEVSLVASDFDDAEEPDLRRSGRFIYLRLRRTAYSADDIERWARRLEPFLADGLDVYVFFRHDRDGASALSAESLLARSSAVIGSWSRER